MSSAIEIVNVDATVTVPTVYADVFASAKSLSSKELYKLGRDILTFLEKQEPKGKKQKRVRDPNAPKKEANWFMKGCSDVIGGVIRDTYFDAESKTWKDEDAKIATINTRVGGILRNRGQFSKEGVIPNKTQILDAFAYYKDHKDEILAEIAAKKAAAEAKKNAPKEAKVTAPVVETPKVVEAPKVVETPKKAEKVETTVPDAPKKEKKDKSEKKEKKEEKVDVPKMVIEEEKVAEK